MKILRFDGIRKAPRYGQKALHPGSAHELSVLVVAAQAQALLRTSIPFLTAARPPSMIALTFVGKNQYELALVGTVSALRFDLCLLREVMDERAYLVKAQEADAFADAADKVSLRQTWESIAKQYRLLARLAAEEREARTARDCHSE